MKIELAVTRSCHHRPILEAELKKMGLPYSIRYLEDDAELQQKFRLRGSPNVLVNGELVFRGMPDVSELKTYLKKNSDRESI